MRSRIHMYSGFDHIVCEAQQDEHESHPVVWIRTEGAAVSLAFNKADRAELRLALDEADAIADKT